MTEAILTKEAILKAKDLVFDTVDVPEWGGTVRLKSLSGFERDKFEASLLDEKKGGRAANLENLRARLISLTVVDKDGVRLFGDKDVVALGRKSAKVLDRLFSKAQEMNGLRKEDVNALTKNSEAAPSDASSSG
jgi:hypothetical protein